MSDMEATLSLANQTLTEWAWETEVTRPAPNRLDATLKDAGDLVEIAVALRVQRLGYLAAITGLDHGPEAGELEVLYHFCTGAAIVTLRVRLPRENPTIASLCEVIPAAEAFERELSEMFGITIAGLRNPERLYLPEDWPEGVYPLRKDVDLKAALAGE